MRKPDVKIAFDGVPVSQQPINVTVRLDNPMPIALRKGQFHIEGPGLVNALILKVSEIPAGGTGVATFKYTPPWAGRCSLVAKFYAKELSDVDGFLAYEVRPRPEDVIIDNDMIGRPGYGDRREVMLEANRLQPRMAANEVRINGNNASPRYISRSNIEI